MAQCNIIFAIGISEKSPNTCVPIAIVALVNNRVLCEYDGLFLEVLAQVHAL